MLSVLLLGLLLGLQHAAEADHLAAVASLATRGGDLRDAARQGAAWGVGHGLTLLVFGGVVLLIDGVVGPQMSLLLETAVGLMLIVLGTDVLYRLWRRRIHFHLHSHGSERHFHAHSHARGQDHSRDPHHHEHRRGLSLRALLVGMVHGMAGSAALILFALGDSSSLWEGLAYLGVFGLGSILGMTALALVISLPLRWSANSLGWAHNGMTAGLGLVTVALGVLLVQQTMWQLLTGGGSV